MCLCKCPGEMRPGSFKVATKTLDASSPGKPGAAAAPAGLQSCGVDAAAQSTPGLDEPLVQSWRGRILTLTQPLVPWGHPDRVGTGTAAVRGQRSAGSRGTRSAAAGSGVPLRLSRSAVAPQLWHQAGEPPPTGTHRHPTAAAALGKRRTQRTACSPGSGKGFSPCLRLTLCEPFLPLCLSASIGLDLTAI